MTTFLAVLVLVFSLPVTPARADAVGAVTCSDVTTPISVPGADPGTIYGRYCRTAVGNGNPLQILVSGSTYSHVYWDLPGVDARYSYARFMNGHGYDTLAIDRLGIGRSTRPALAAFVDPGYATTQPGKRGYFYAASKADPAVIAADEQTKDTLSSAEIDWMVHANSGMTARIKVPTLRILGERDPVMCNPDPCTQQWMEKTAPALFPAGVEVFSQPGGGHNVALERGNTDGFQVALSWLERHFGGSG